MFVFGRHGSHNAERPDEVFGERQYNDGHLGRANVHDAHPRIYETWQRSPELVHVCECRLIETKFASRFIDNRTEFGVRHGT